MTFKILSHPAQFLSTMYTLATGPFWGGCDDWVKQSSATNDAFHASCMPSLDPVQAKQLSEKLSLLSGVELGTRGLLSTTPVGVSDLKTPGPSNFQNSLIWILGGRRIQGRAASQSTLDGSRIGKKGLMRTPSRAHETLLEEGKRGEGRGGEGGIEQRIDLYARPSVILRSLPHGRRKAVPRALLP